MRTIFPLAVLLAISGPASAECMSKFYIVSGTIISEDKSPVANAIVGASWKEGESIGGPALGKTDARGNYSIVVEFKSYSAIPRGKWYECKGKLKSLQISAYTDLRYSPPISVPVRDDTTDVRADPIDLFLEIKDQLPGKDG